MERIKEIKNMKKLLIVAKSLGGGGSEVALVELLNHLNPKKFEITLLLLDHDNEYKYRLKKNVTIKYITFDNNYYHKLVSMYSFVGKAIKKSKMNRWTRIYDIVAKHSLKLKEHFDIAIDFYGYGSFTTAYLARNISADKKAFWLHDEKMLWIKNVENYFSDFNKIFCVSYAIKKEFDKLYPSEQTKSEVFYNVLDISQIIEKSQKFIPKEFDRTDFNIVTVGRLTEQKGYDISIKAANILKKEGFNFHWYAIGDGRDKEKLERLIHKMGLQNNFSLLGRRDNPYPYIKHCDVYVQPSRHEGYSIALTEARVLKKLIITSDFPANKEQIQNGVTGLIVKLDPDDLATQIKRVYFDDTLRRKILKNISEQKIDVIKELKKLDNI